MIRTAWSRLVRGAVVLLQERFSRVSDQFRLRRFGTGGPRPRRFVLSPVAAEVQCLESRLLLSVLTDTTTASTVNATAGSSTGNVVLATFTEGAQTITIDPPGATSTEVVAVSGSEAVGDYTDASNVQHGFIYNGSSYTTFDPTGSVFTSPNGVSGGVIVGSYRDSQNVTHGFKYDGSSVTTIDDPGTTTDTVATAISGNTIVGTFTDSNRVTHGFVYDGTSYRTIDAPGASTTYPESVSGSEVTGLYFDANNVSHGFVFDGTTLTTLDVPGATDTYAYGISGNNIVGSFISGSQEHGFVYNGSTYTTLDVPAGSSSGPVRISGNFIAGIFADPTASFFTRGFLYDGQTYVKLAPVGVRSIESVRGLSGGNAGGGYFDSSNTVHGFLYLTAIDPTMLTPTVNWGGTVTGTPTVSVQMVSQTATGSTWEVIGNVTYAQAGNYTPSVSVTGPYGANLSANETSFDVGAPQGPSFTSASSATFATGTAESFAVTATGSPVPTLSESSSDRLPAGVTFNPAAGLLSGAPAAGSAGAYTLHFTARNGVGTDATQTFTLTINQVLTDTTTASTVNATAGSSTGNVVLATFSESAQSLIVDPPATQLGDANAVSGSTVGGDYIDSNNNTHGFVYNGTTYTTIDPPGATTYQGQGTVVSAISGNSAVGSFYDSNHVQHAFLYNGSTYTKIDGPEAISTGALGISGSDVVGTYFDSNSSNPHAFLYNGSSAVNIDPPGTTYAEAFGVSGNDVVGYFSLNGVQKGFLYDGKSYTTIAPPGSTYSIATGISGSNVVGFYGNSSGKHGFLYNGSSYVTIDPPGSTATLVEGVSGNVVTGRFVDASSQDHGFLYDGTTYTVIDAPAGYSEPELYGVSGTNAVGDAFDSSSNNHGFLYLTAIDPSAFAPNVNWGGTVAGTPTVSLKMLSQTATGSTWEVIGNVTYAQPGTYTPSVSVTGPYGASLTANETAFDVSGGQSAPSFSGSTSATFAVGLPGSVTITASGVPAPALSESNTDRLPSGVTFDPTTGILSGTPAAGANGDYTLHFTASNGVSPDATETFTLRVTSAFPLAGEYAVSTASGSPTLASIAQNGTQLTLAGTSTASATITSGDQILVNGTDTATYGDGSITFTTGQFAGQTWTKISLPTSFTNPQGAPVSISQDGANITFTDKYGHTATGAWVTPTTLTAFGETVTIGNGQLFWSSGVTWSQSFSVTGTQNRGDQVTLNALANAVSVANYVDQNGKSTYVVSNGTMKVAIIDSQGEMFLGIFSDTVHASFSGYVGGNGQFIGGPIYWQNGDVWTPTSATGASPPVVTHYTNSVGVATHVVQNGTNTVIFIDMLGEISLATLTGNLAVDPRYAGDTATFGTNTVTWQDGNVWTETANPPVNVIATIQNGGVSHLQLTSATTLVGLDGPMQGMTGTRVNNEIDWSNGTVWSNFDYDLLDALFELGTGGV